MGERFKDKVVLVTGGSRGLGRAISLGFAREGAKVVVASRKLASCEQVVALIEAEGGAALAHAAHMGDMAALDALIEASYAHFGRVDILVNNAGTGEHGGGCVINVISVAALATPAYSGIYAATKAALQALTEVMAQEWAAWNIRVNALAPGSYHSDLTDSAIETIPGYGDGMVAAALIPRIADTEEILNPVFYLASEGYTTGITLVADGGLMAKR